MRTWRACGAAFALACAAVLADVPVPALTARVTDLTGTLDADQRNALEQRLAAFEAAKGSQIAVLIVPTTQPEEIEQYSIRVTDAWKLGRKGIDDGALLLVAKDDHKMRIEVGRGLEGPLPDAIAKRIIAEVITPKFKDGDFAGGIDAGIEQMIKVVDGEPLPPPAKGARRHAGGDDGPFGTLMTIGFFVLMFTRFLSRLFGEVPSALLGGSVFGLIGWGILGSLLAGGASGIILFVIALIMLLSRGHGGGFGGGGWTSGGGSSFGGGGGGGFSGGGGGFSGGGASGGW